MVATMSLPFLTTLVFALSPVAAIAQESSLEAEQPEPLAVEAAPEPSSSNAELLLAPLATNLPSADGASVTETSPLDAGFASPASAAAAKGSGTGLGFMIGGAAAFVGGLIIGETGGGIIAAGGVGLAVYGAIIYF